MTRPLRMYLMMRYSEFHILVILENYVCIRKLAQRTGDEALHPDVLSIISADCRISVL